MTAIYKLDGKYFGRTSASALRIGKVISLFEVHVACSDQAKAEMARLAPNNADRINCDLLPPSAPYTIVEEQPHAGTSRGFSMLCLRPLRQEVACRWVFLAAEESN
jgi:hypothetical protein